MVALFGLAGKGSPSRTPRNPDTATPPPPYTQDNQDSTPDLYVAFFHYLGSQLISEHRGSSRMPSLYPLSGQMQPYHDRPSCRSMIEGSSQIVLQVTQVWRGKDSDGRVRPLHWALTFKTAGTDDHPVGNCYNAAGNVDTFSYEAERNVPLRSANWRGSLAIGRVPAESLHKFEHILSQIPIIRHDPSWNCQTWVWTSLRELRHAGFSVEPNLSWSRLRDTMLDLLEAWECGDI